MNSKEYICNSVGYSLWFLIFMLIESFANTRIGETLGTEKVEIYYAIFLLFTAMGFLIFGLLGKKACTNRILLLVVIVTGCIATFVMTMSDARLVIAGSGLALLSIAYIGGNYLYSISKYYEYKKNIGLTVGIATAVAVFLQFIVQSVTIKRVFEIVVYTLLFVLLFVVEICRRRIGFEINAKPVIDDNSEGDHQPVKFNEWKIFIVYSIATVLMSAILSLNDTYLVDLSATTNTVNLFSDVRLFYCLSLIVAGILYDYKKCTYFNMSVACVMMLATIAYAFLGNATDYNINMSIMYFYCGFYVMFFTMHFIKIANMAIKINDNKAYMFSGMGRVLRCVTTSGMTMLYVNDNNISAEKMIVISCVLAILLVVLLAVNELLVIKEQTQKMEESLVIYGKNDILDVKEEMWLSFTEKFAFTERECEVLNKLINTEDALQEISDELDISKRVLQRHITSIYKKTQRSTRIGLMQLYMEHLHGGK